MSVVLIPAFEPDVRLVSLVRALRGADPARPVVVVDDGSGERYAAVFAQAEASGAVLLAHPCNRGKGAALKTGMAAIARWWPGADVVTADCDGQHTAADIERIARAVSGRNLPRADTTLVLGVRSFTGDVPARSRIGNTLPRWVFQLVTGRALRDTQTGLRGIPAAAVPELLDVPGDRFDYEFRMLLRARPAGIALAEEPVSTVYTAGNASSHFRPIVDSLRVYAPLARFAASALFAFAVDTGMLLLLNALTGRLFFSVVGARVVSASANFAINRRLVFRRGRDVPMRTAAVRYFSLAALLLAANFGTITALTDAGMPLLTAKLVTEATLFVVSFAVQRAVVFTGAEAPEPVIDAAAAPRDPALRR